MKTKLLLAIGIATGALGIGPGVAHALSCAAPSYDATLVPLDGGEENLCIISTAATEVVVVPCERRGAFDDEVYVR